MAAPPKIESVVSPLRAAGFFAFRTPLLPLDEFTAWSSGLSAKDAAASDDATLASALAKDEDVLRARLRAIILRPEVREALFLASPSLIESLPEWLKAPASERGQKVERTLCRYFARMCARATPFGLFAGCSTGELGARTELTLPPRASYQRHTRLDMDYLFPLAETLAKELRAVLTHNPSSSIYGAGAELRYVEGKVDRGSRAYVLTSVERTDYLDAVLTRARGGARPIELATSLVTDDVSLEEATEYVDQLIDSQILVPALAPAVTGPEPIHDLIAQLRAVPPGAAAAATLEDARARIEAIDAAPLGVDEGRYREIAERLEVLPQKVELPRLFQVDMVKGGRATLGPKVLQEIERGVGVLQRLGARWPGPLDRFRDAFTRRYEDRSVPLCEALDEESGIGFDASSAPATEGSPLLAGLPFVGRGDERIEADGRRHRFLMRRLFETLRKGRDELVLGEADYAELSEPRLRWPHSLYAIATVLARSSADIDEGRFRVSLSSAGGPSGANLLGRFCHGDARLAELVREHVRAEEALDPDTIYAEVVHLPEGRIGNILLRPLLRDHEIAFLGRSGAPAAQQLELSDLWVSVVGDRVVLRSKRLGRRVVPRLSSAHNYSYRGLGAYRFLCMLQSQGVLGGSSFGWGALDEAPFLPRVTDGRLILSRARWLLRAEALKPLSEGTPAQRFRHAQRLREEHRLPRVVCVEDADNELSIDLENLLSIDTFAQLVRRRAAVQLTEPLCTPEELCATGPEGHFVHELLVPFLCPSEPAVAAPSLPPLPIAPAPRSFTPGSEWLYAKLYCGAEGADRVLTQAVAPLVEELVGEGVVDRWFFIRYSDPDWHVRLRLHGAPDALMKVALPRLHAAARPLLDTRELWRLQIDTYEREVARYGGDRGMALCERLFHADSEAALAILTALDRDDVADGRWRLTLRSIDRLLDDLGFSLEEKRALMARARDGFALEFVGTALERGLGDKYRKERAGIDALLAAEAAGDAEWLAQGFGLLDQRSTRQRPIAEELRRLASDGGLEVELGDVALSLVHMCCNRLLRGAARAHERVLYDFLYRQLDSQLARKRR